jgi:putative nucleotidyltransferase with HDIG domain
MNAHPTAPTKEKRFFPIYLESLRVNAVLDFDLYLKQAKEYVLYRSGFLPFTERTRQSLIENSVDRLFVSKYDNRAYFRYLESNLRDLVNDEAIEGSRRAGMVYDSAKFLIAELFDNPCLGENLRRSKELVETTVDFVLDSPSALEGLLQIMEYDYTTFTHSVNVCALALALARRVGIEDPAALRALGVGALLHDIGKTKVSESILNKPDTLSPDEMFVVRRHPQWGWELTHESDLLDSDSYYPILQHHEREDGSGYPSGIGGGKIHLYGKITAIADAFDAMTTRRAHRPAIEAFTALSQMFDQEGSFDRELLGEFTKMLGPSEGGLDRDDESS